MTDGPSKWLALVGGVLLVGGLGFIVRANVSTTDDCSDAEARHPFDGACISRIEMCEVTFEEGGRDTSSCGAISKDGTILLQLELNGSGDANVRIKDGDGDNVLDERYRLTYGLEATLKGAPGEWTVEGDFRRANGAGFVRVWG